MRAPTAPVLVWLALGSAVSCSAPNPPSPAVTLGSAADRLKPVTSPLPQDYVQRRVYVSVYSSIYLGLQTEQLMVNLAATVSVRNVSGEHAVVLTHARYYDSAGKVVRDYVQAPAELGPMASVEFVVKRDDTAGGPGANFVIEWTGPADMDPPIVEAVMIGQSGHAGFSFISEGKAIQHPLADAPKVAPSPKTSPRPALQSRPPAKPTKTSKETRPVKPTKPNGDRNNARRPSRPAPTPKVPTRKGNTGKG